MRKIKLMVSIAMSAVLLLTNCVKNEESEGVKALRMAQAGLYNAKAAAETTVAEAEAAYRNALAAVETAKAAKETALANIEAANARALELANELKEAQNASDTAKLAADLRTYKAKAEAELIEAQNDIEVAKLEAEQSLAEANKNLKLSLDILAMEIYDAKNDELADLWAMYTPIINTVRNLRNEITGLVYDIEADELALANWDLKDDNLLEGNNYEFFTEEVNEDIAELQQDIIDETEILTELEADLTALEAVAAGTTDFESVKKTLENEIKTMEAEIADLEKQEADAQLAIDDYEDSDAYKTAMEDYEMAFETKFGAIPYEEKEYIPGFPAYNLGAGDYNPAARIETIEQLIINANNAINGVTDNNKNLSETNDQLGTINDGLEAQLTTYQSDYSSKLTAFNSAKSTYETAKVAYDAAQAAYDVDNSAANLTARDQALSDLNDAQNDLNDAENDLNIAENNVDNTQTAISNNENTIDNNQSTIVSNLLIIERHNDGVDMMEAEIVTIQEDIDDATANIDTYQTAFMAAETALSDLMDAKQAITDDIDNHESLLANKETLSASIDNSTYEDIMDVIDDLEADIEDQMAAIDEIEASIAALQILLADDQIDEDEFAALIEEDKLELAEKQDDLTKREAQANDVKSEIQAKLDELAAL